MKGLRGWIVVTFSARPGDSESLRLWRRFLAWLLRMDRLAQDKWFGGRFETISGHLGRVQQRYGGSIPWRARPLQALVSRVLDWIDPDHCKKSIGY